VVLMPKELFRFTTPDIVVYDSPLTENYAYLFYEEINPPPPKVC
jgi:hypothetical protein